MNDLDKKVAEALGLKVFTVPLKKRKNTVVGGEHFTEDLSGIRKYDLVFAEYRHDKWLLGKYDYWEDGLIQLKNLFYPSTNWAHGGPLIEEEQIAIEPVEFHNGKVTKWSADCRDYKESFTEYGETPLIAAMKALIAALSK